MTTHQDIEGRQPIEHRRVATNAAVYLPVFKQRPERAEGEEHRVAALRSDQARLDEAVGLAKAIGLEIVDSGVVTSAKLRPATLIGPGKVEEMAGVIAAGEIGLVIIDHPLSPVQQRNLEKELGAKVLDRTGLILEIFGERARTKEGRLQVELAHLNYQRGRLVRSWTHLERQRGGAGFMGGPGETQIEADRRQLQDKIKRLEKELDQVKRTRSLHRAKRKKVPHPIIALVGYTNAGKSTLFNRLTGADAFAKDLLFATLDPTLRRLVLPHGTEVIFSDTVGFISDLPTHLVAAFRATLEEVIEADIVLHVRDMADADNLAQAEDVKQILRDLGIEAEDEAHVLEVWNKIDRLDEPSLTHLQTVRSAMPDEASVFLVSAETGTGVPNLVADIERRLAGRLGEFKVEIGPQAMSVLPWIYENSRVLAREDEEDGAVALTAEMTVQAHTDLRRMGETMPGLRIG